MVGKAESIIIQNEDFQTKTINVWRDYESGYSRIEDNAPATLDFNYGMASVSEKVNLTRFY